MRASLGGGGTDEGGQVAPGDNEQEAEGARQVVVEGAGQAGTGAAATESPAAGEQKAQLGFRLLLLGSLFTSPVSFNPLGTISLESCVPARGTRNFGAIPCSQRWVFRLTLCFRIAGLVLRDAPLLLQKKKKKKGGGFNNNVLQSRAISLSAAYPHCLVLPANILRLYIE